VKEIGGRRKDGYWKVTWYGDRGVKRKDGEWGGRSGESVGMGGRRGGDWGNNRGDKEKGG